MTEQVEIRTDHKITGSNAVGPARAQELHEWPDELPDVDDKLTVAVMDSGIHQDLLDNDHPWFEGSEVVERYDATGAGTGGDDVGHGSGVASIIAKNTPGVEFYDVRIFGDSGTSGWDVIRDAYEWLIDHGEEIDIVNMSWGARNDVQAINQLHDKLLQKGVHDVVAAGNTGGEGGSPSTAPKAFSAGAVDEHGDLTRFTSRDPNQDNPDVAALGKDVRMARAPGTSMGSPINSQSTKASGTSFAAPYTAAAYANAMYLKRQSWDRPFEQAAVDIPGSKADGDGVLKLNPAIKDYREDDNPNPKTDSSIWSFGGSDTIFLGVDWLDDGHTVIEKVDESKDTVTLEVQK